ncbi:MAG: acyl-CoA dehydrogenase family protein [Acidimicrobiales bacterium]|nr:acyl-CoA dehydrogenase family protein [Acidimicrobiales bacterium]
MANDSIRDEVRAWLEQHWDPTLGVVEWRNKLADSGWGCVTWPVEWYGKGLAGSLEAVVREQFDKVGAVGVAAGVGMSLAAPTILGHGTDDVKSRFLKPTLTGEYKWCQLFSEPGSGSDLAGLTTKAELDGDEWVISGQKVWNSGAHKAAYGILLARTNWDVPKHKGISYFAIDMRQPGIEVRPLRQANGYSTFNEVFLDEARVPAANIIGDRDNGWAIALTTLAHERGANTARRPKFRNVAAGRCVAEAAQESAEYFSTYSWYPQRAGRPDLVPVQVRETGQSEDPVVRQQAMVVATQERLNRWTVQRSVAARKAGRPPGPEGSLAKLNGSLLARLCNAAHSEIVGAHGMLIGEEGPQNGMVNEVLISTPAMSIAGGTDEIQHNIIGERVLGLPKEPGSDADQPFRQVRTNLG